MSMFNAGLFTLAKLYNKAKSLTTEKWMEKGMVYIHSGKKNSHNDFRKMAVSETNNIKLIKLVLGRELPQVVSYLWVLGFIQISKIIYVQVI